MNKKEMFKRYGNLPVPKRAEYFGKKNAVEQFKVHDSPLAFYDLTDDDQELLLNWISLNLSPVKIINKDITSYKLKHLFEVDLSGEGEHKYVSQGSLKGAMIASGFIHDAERDLNWCFNISKKDVTVLRERLDR